MKNYRRWDMDRTLLLTTILSCIGTAFMYLYASGYLPVRSIVVERVFYIAEIGINLGYLLCNFRLLKTIYEVIGWDTKNLGILKWGSIVGSLSLISANFFKSIRECNSYWDIASSFFNLIVCLTLLYLSLKINNEVEQRQAGELGQIDIANYRPSPFLSLELDVFWDRFSWFQLLIVSLIIANLSNLFTGLVTLVYSDVYASMDSCQLVYPLVYNPLQPKTLDQKYHAIAVSVMVFNFLMADFIPYIFLLRIIEVNLIKKR